MRYIPVIVLLSLIFVSCGKKEPQAFTQDQLRVFKYIPHDVQFLLYTNLTEIRKSGHWEGLLKNSVNQKTENWLTDFEKKTGAGLSGGISELYTCTTWEGNDLVIVTFNKKKEEIERYFRDTTKFVHSGLSGKVVYKLTGKNFPNFYFADSTTLIIIKSEDYLARLTTGSNRSIKNNKEFLKIVDNINLKHHYWMVTNQGSYAAALVKMLLGNGRDVPGKELVASIKDISLAAEFSDNVLVESVLGCKDEKSAYMISAAIGSAVAMDLFSGVDSNLGALMKDLDVKRESNKLSLELLLNKKDILQLKELSKKRLTDKNL